MPRTPDPAPHGRDDHGVPLAPYGYTVTGQPKKSNRGRPRTGTPTAPAAPPAAVGARTNLKDSERKGMLVDLLDGILVSSLAGASQVSFLTRWLGPRQVDALAGDAFILSQFGPGLADGLILLSKTKPKALAWLDKAQENAPWILFAQVGIGMAKAIAGNHINPDPRLADAGRNYTRMRMQAMAAEVNAQAEALQRAAMDTNDLYEDQDQDEPTSQFAHSAV